jgi:DNA repair protein RadC
VSYRRRRVAGGGLLPFARIGDGGEAARAFVRLLRDEPVEVCGLLCLTVRKDVLCYHELSRGTLDTALIDPREVFKVALLANAQSIIVGHNHPSGDPEPSPNDLRLTDRLRRAGEVMGIDLLDHIVIGTNGYVSIRDLNPF